MTKNKKLKKKIQKMAAADLDIDVLQSKRADEVPPPPADDHGIVTPPESEVTALPDDDESSDDSSDESDQLAPTADDSDSDSNDEDDESTAAGPTYAGPEVQEGDPNQSMAPASPASPGATPPVDPGAASDSSSDLSVSSDEMGAQQPGVGGPTDDPTTPIPAEAGVDEMIIHPIAEVLNEKTASLEMFLFDAQGKNPTWMVIANGDPYAKICLADQENPELIRQAFCADSYADTVMANAKKLGMMTVLADVKARFYHAQIFKSKLAETLTKKITANVEKRVATANYKYNERVAEMMHLVVKAAAVNFFKDPDPFKAAMVQVMRTAGVADPTAAVEQLFTTHAPEWFKRVLAKATEWTTFAPDAMKQIRASIDDMGVRSVDYVAAAAQDARDTARHEVAAPTAMAVGVPLVTQGYHSHSLVPQSAGARVAATSEEEQLRQQYRTRLQGLRQSRRTGE
jgi:hypothetical protein